MADTLSGGRLADELVKLDAEGLSLRAIARRLQEDHHILVSHVTIGAWLDTLTEGAA